MLCITYSLNSDNNILFLINITDNIRKADKYNCECKNI